MKTQAPNRMPPDSLRHLPGRRILFFLNWLRPGAGMINREIAFARVFAEHGAQVSILSHFKPQIDPGDPRIQVETLVPTGFRDRWYNTGYTRGLIDFRARRVLKRLQPDIVFTDLPVEAERMLRLRERGGPDVSIAYTYHGTADGSAYDPETARALAASRAFAHRMLRTVDLPLVVSDHLVREARVEGSTPLRIYNGVDLEHWSPAPAGTLPAGPPRVLYVGRYTECKGVLSLVQAFGRAAAQVPDAILQMHGFFERPDYEARIRQAIADSGAAERIEMHGPLDFADIPEQLRRCTVFANGSVDESFCMPFLEAQACGRSCVGFDSRGIPEVVLHEQTGLLAPPGEIATFGDHLTRLLLDTALRNRFERAARAHAETFDYLRLAGQLASALPPVRPGVPA